MAPDNDGAGGSGKEIGIVETKCLMDAEQEAELYWPRPGFPEAQIATGLERTGIELAEDIQRHLHEQALAQFGDAVTITNRDGIIEYVNAAFESLTGYSADEAIGRSVSLLKSGEHDRCFYADAWALLIQGGPYRGIFANRSKNGLLFHEEKTISPIRDRAGRITHYIAIGHSVLSDVAAERQLHQFAYYDRLTGLPNRQLFMIQLKNFVEQSLPNTEALVMLLDINNLKKINDTLGHRVGDQVLRMVGKRLEGFCKRTSTLARWGGDEFTLLVRSNDTSAQAIAQHVLDILAQPLNLGHQEAFLSASIGIARFPRDSRDADDLMCHADLALHRAKEAGRNLFLFYQEAMRSSLHEDLRIETELHGALERKEMHLVFQPIVCSADGAKVGWEALLRWNSSTLGSVSPTRFIPQLERTGLIVPVGRWVLHTACQAIAAMPCSKTTPLRLAVNVSARQLLHPSFVTDVKTALEQSRLAPDRLELEITESVLIENAAAASSVLKSLRQYGVHIAADDFGTGYSSLSYLWKFPFSTLKIDRSFVARLLNDKQVQVIVGSILNLARELGFGVVAEGVETTAQFDWLKDLGCPYIQGYFTGEPSTLTISQHAF